MGASGSKYILSSGQKTVAPGTFSIAKLDFGICTVHQGLHMNIMGFAAVCLQLPVMLTPMMGMGGGPPREGAPTVVRPPTRVLMGQLT